MAVEEDSPPAACAAEGGFRNRCSRRRPSSTHGETLLAQAFRQFDRRAPGISEPGRGNAVRMHAVRRVKLHATHLELSAEGLEIGDLEANVIEHASFCRRRRTLGAREIHVDTWQISGLIVPTLSVDASEQPRVPLFRLDLNACGDIQMYVMHDDRHRHLAVMPLGSGITQSGIESEHEIL